MMATVQCSICSQLNNKSRVVVTDFRLHHSCSIIIIEKHQSPNFRCNLTEMLHVLGKHTGMKPSCIKPMSKVRGLSIEPRSSTGCID